jgi:hypothetical protein
MKTVAIVGNASRTRRFVPYDDPTVDIWLMGVHAWDSPRRTAILEMHPDVLLHPDWMRKAPNGPVYRDWLLEQTETPVYMHRVHKLIPASIEYPRKEIETRYGLHLWKGDEQLLTTFGGTASYCLPLAMYLGYERVEIYGIELAARPKYDEERDLFFLWMGRATALGINVIIHKESRLIRKVLYPL